MVLLEAPPEVRTPRLRKGRSRAARRSVAGLLFVTPTVITILALFVTPFVIVVFMSMSDWPLLGTPQLIGVGNYLRLASQSQFVNAISFTLLYTVLCTVAIFVIALAMAAFLNSARRGVRFYRTAIFLPYVVGLSTASLMWVVNYNDQVGIFAAVLRRLGVIDGPVGFFRTSLSATLAVIVMIVWKYVGFQVIILLIALQAIPASVNEAALCDGASSWQKFRYVTLPFLRPTLALLLVLSVTGSLLAFDQFVVLTQGGPDNTTITMVMAIYNTAFTSYDLGTAAALSIVLLVALVGINALQMRLVRGRDQ